mgnify:CR=1 FL=1
MTTTLLSTEQELSRQLGDYWSSTTTSAGDSSGTSLIDTALRVKPEGWITDEATAIMTSGTYDTVEREIESLDTETGTLVFKQPFAGAIAISVTYEIHRLFSAEEKKRACIYGARKGYPSIYKRIRDETLTVGNWLKNGDQEIWTLTTNADNWLASTVTAVKNTNTLYLTRGTSSVKLSTAAGYYYQSDTQIEDFRHLIGQTVTFKAKVHCNTASCARLGILYDGTNVEYSEYHPGSSKFCDDDGDNKPGDFLEVEKTIDDAPTAISFRVYHDVAAAITYVDDLRVTGPTRDKHYIGNMGLNFNEPSELFQSSDANIYDEPWQPLRTMEVDKDGYLYPWGGTQGYRLRIKGRGALNYLLSGAVSTSWTASIDLDAPQLEILIAEAAIYLYTQRILPNYTSGDNQTYMNALAYWKNELRERQSKFAMPQPLVTMRRNV